MVDSEFNHLGIEEESPMPWNVSHVEEGTKTANDVLMRTNLRLKNLIDESHFYLEVQRGGYSIWSQELNLRAP